MHVCSFRKEAWRNRNKGYSHRRPDTFAFKVLDIIFEATFIYPVASKPVSSVFNWFVVSFCCQVGSNYTTYTYIVLLLQKSDNTYPDFPSLLLFLQWIWLWELYNLFVVFFFSVYRKHWHPIDVSVFMVYRTACVMSQATSWVVLCRPSFRSKAG